MELIFLSLSFKIIILSPFLTGSETSPIFILVIKVRISFDKDLPLTHPNLPSLDEEEEILNFTTASSKLNLLITF